MLVKFRRHLPLIIGGSAVLIILDGIIAIYRAIGLDKGTAIYAGILTLGCVGWLLIRRFYAKGKG